MSSPSNFANAPKGTWHPTPSERRRARSAVAHRWAFLSVISAPILKRSPSSGVSRATTPWQGAGRKGRIERCGALIPSRSSPARASTMASSSPHCSLRTRVGMFPLSSTTLRSGRARRSCARRRGLDVPTEARGRRVFRSRSSLHRRTSSGASRPDTAAIPSPSPQLDGRSFRLWTAPSPSPRRSASSMQLEKAPEPPKDLSGLDLSLSPLVTTRLMATSWPRARRGAAIISV